MADPVVAALSAVRHLRPSRVVALDFSPRMLDRARAKAHRHDPERRIEWRAEPAVPLRIDSGSADVVLCSLSLHFLGHAALAEWRRVLRPGGRIAFSLPCAADFTPSPSFPPLVVDQPVIPFEASQAARTALESGFDHVDVRQCAAVSEDRPRRAFLVWAQAPLPR